MSASQQFETYFNRYWDRGREVTVWWGLRGGNVLFVVSSRGK